MPLHTRRRTTVSPLASRTVGDAGSPPAALIARAHEIDTANQYAGNAPIIARRNRGNRAIALYLCGDQAERLRD